MAAVRIILSLWRTNCTGLHSQRYSCQNPLATLSQKPVRFHFDTHVAASKQGLIPGLWNRSTMSINSNICRWPRRTRRSVTSHQRDQPHGAHTLIPGKRGYQPPMELFAKIWILNDLSRALFLFTPPFLSPSSPSSAPSRNFYQPLPGVSWTSVFLFILN